MENNKHSLSEIEKFKELFPEDSFIEDGIKAIIFHYNWRLLRLSERLDEINSALPKIVRTALRLSALVKEAERRNRKAAL